MGNNSRKQVNQYDKIIKENLEVTLPVIIRDIIGLDILISEELPDDVQHTKERKPDALKKITDLNGNTYILQVEFQLKDEKEMVYRMAEYSIMLMRRYQLPVKQYVIFMKDTIPGMPTCLDTTHHKFDFTLIRLAEASYKIFLNSDNPEVKMLGILANFDRDDQYRAVKSIVEHIQSSTKSDFAKSRYFRQLRIFVQLRNSIVPQFEKAMESVNTFFKEENDFLYRRGEARGEAMGEEKTKLLVVENLIIKSQLTDEQVADIAAVDLEYVSNIRAELKK